MQFENDVKMYGTQTAFVHSRTWNLFENDVKMYGTQTSGAIHTTCTEFENDVKMYGTQTLMEWGETQNSLRMM